MGYGLGRRERLTKRDFRSNHWKKSGRTDHFFLFEKRTQEPMARFGVTVSRKVRGSVLRNRIKRLLREFFRLNKHLFKESRAYSVRVNHLPGMLCLRAVGEELQVLLSGSRSA